MDRRALGVMMRLGDDRRYAEMEILPQTLVPDTASLLAIPGGPGYSRHTLLPWLMPLTRVMRVAGIDLPGSGDAALGVDLAFSWASYASDLKLAHDALGGRPIIVLGHAWGAAMAVEYALAEPTDVAGLVLVNPLCSFNPSGPDDGAQARMVERTDPSLLPDWVEGVWPDFQAASAGDLPWEKVEASSWWGRMIRTQFAECPVEWEKRMADVPWRLRSYAQFKGAGMLDPSSAMATYDLIERADALSQTLPVLTVTSAHDANYVAPTKLHAARLSAARPTAQLCHFDELGHFPFVERSEAFAEAVVQFLKVQRLL